MQADVRTFRSRVLQDAARRPYAADFTAASDEDWIRLGSSSCAFCGSNQKSSRNMLNVAVNDWKQPLKGDNLVPSCPLCWSIRNGKSPSELYEKALQIHLFRTEGRELAYLRRCDDELNNAQTSRATAVRKRSTQREAAHCGSATDLSHQQVAKLLAFPCWYCGQTSTGVDRLNSEKCPGYTSKNVVPCCRDCNSMKHVLPRGLFLSHIDRIANLSTASQTQLFKNQANHDGKVVAKAQ